MSSMEIPVHVCMIGFQCHYIIDFCSCMACSSPFWGQFEWTNSFRLYENPF